jgi:hypothetical protein
VADDGDAPEADFPDVLLDELLDELTLQDASADPDAVAEVDADADEDGDGEAAEGAGGAMQADA